MIAVSWSFLFCIMVVRSHRSILLFSDLFYPPNMIKLRGSSCTFEKLRFSDELVFRICILSFVLGGIYKLLCLQYPVNVSLDLCFLIHFCSTSSIFFCDFLDGLLSAGFRCVSIVDFSSSSSGFLKISYNLEEMYFLPRHFRYIL